jgi:ferric-dicitrate binding protein FerR (iron transport regulator)
MLDINRTWLLIGRKLANEASSQELEELESILRSSPELHFSLQTLSDLWQKEPAKDTVGLEAAYCTLLDRMKSQGADVPGTHHDDFSDAAVMISYPPRRKIFSLRNVLTTATLVAAIAAVWIINPFAPTKPKAPIAKETSEISTRYGSKTNIVLPDGSKVWLNAGSKITYDKVFGEALREVNLIGEAYFDVVHDASRPFIIHTRAMDIRVLGTEFNVKSYPDEKTTETSLIRGSIEVTLKRRNADKIILKPNEKLVVSNDNATDEDKVAVPQKKIIKHTPIINLGTLNYFSLDSTILETSWVNNRLVFEDESFEEIAHRMSRWYGVNFLFKDEDVKNLRFTGNFRNETIVEALDAMQITADFGFKIEDKNVIITKR